MRLLSVSAKMSLSYEEAEDESGRKGIFFRGLKDRRIFFSK
jgi:hypothetical protein